MDSTSSIYLYEKLNWDAFLSYREKRLYERCQLGKGHNLFLFPWECRLCCKTFSAKTMKMLSTRNFNNSTLMMSLFNLLAIGIRLFLHKIGFLRNPLPNICIDLRLPFMSMKEIPIILASLLLTFSWGIVSCVNGRTPCGIKKWHERYLLKPEVCWCNNIFSVVWKGTAQKKIHC